MLKQWINNITRINQFKGIKLILYLFTIKSMITNGILIFISVNNNKVIKLIIINLTINLESISDKTDIVGHSIYIQGPKINKFWI